MKRFRTTTLLLACAATFALSVLLTGCGGDDNVDLDVPPPSGYLFFTSPATAYARVERIGLPGVAQNIPTESRKDEYNQDGPTDDVTLKYKPDFDATLDVYHPTFDPQIQAMMINDPAPFGPLRPLVPCTSPSTTPPGAVPGDVDFESCWANIAPALLPDTIKVFVGLAPGFPNGRQLAISCPSRLGDPLSSFSTGTHSVIDQLLASSLLAVSAPGQEVQRCYFGNLPLNPPTNDVPFRADFPFLAAAH